MDAATDRARCGVWWSHAARATRLSSTVLLEISWVADKAVGRFPDAEGVYGLRCMFHVAGPHQVLPLILQQRLFSQAARDAPNFYNLGPGTGAADNFDVAPGHT